MSIQSGPSSPSKSLNERQLCFTIRGIADASSASVFTQRLTSLRPPYRCSFAAAAEYPTMNRPLPYPIPGPAGNLSPSLMKSSNVSRREPPSSSSSSSSSSSASSFLPNESGFDGRTPHAHLTFNKNNTSSPAGIAQSKYNGIQSSKPISNQQQQHQQGLNKLINNLDCDAQQMQVFRTGPWVRMYESLSDKTLKSSLASVRRLALLQAGARLSMLPVLVSNMKWVGRDAATTLTDPTASLQATIHANVFTHFANSTPITDGCVLLLNDVSAVVYDDEAKGFRVDVMQSIHLNVRLQNVGRVFMPSKNSLPTLPVHPAQMYTEFARAPPLPNIRRVLRDRMNHTRHNAHHKNYQPHHGIGVNPPQSSPNQNSMRNTAKPPLQHHPYPQRQQQQQQQRQQYGTNIPRKRPFGNPAPVSGQGLDHSSQVNQPYPKRAATQNNFASRPSPASAFRPPSRFPSNAATTPVRQEQATVLSSSSRMASTPASNPSGPATSFSTAAPSPPETDSAMDGFDEHLDSIMGGFDIDSVINEHRKSQALMTSSSSMPSHPPPQQQRQPTQQPCTDQTLNNQTGIPRQQNQIQQQTNTPVPSGLSNSGLSSGDICASGTVASANNNSGGNVNRENYHQHPNQNANGMPNEAAMLPSDKSKVVKDLMAGLDPTEFL